MKSSLLHFGALITAAFCMLSCAEQSNSWRDLNGGSANLTDSTDLQLLSLSKLTVIDEAGLPIPQATVLVGFEPGNPFPGNLLTTDQLGMAEVPADWKAALPVTVQAPGFIANTIPVALPGEMSVRLFKQEGRQELEVQGKATEFGRIIKDGKIDFALVIPALTRSQMLAFDLSTVISPKTDTISIIGNDIEIPSNISLPKQTENYIFPITIDKPAYRVYMRDPGQYVVSATHGQFPLQRVISEIRAGKSMFEIINHFTFLGGGHQQLDVQGNIKNADLPVNQSRFTSQVRVTAPNYSAQHVMISLALKEQNDLLLPTDLKRLTPGQSMNMKTDSTGSSTVLSLLLENSPSLTSNAPFVKLFEPLLKLEGGWLAPQPQVKDSQDFAKLSFAILPADGGAVSPQFLPLVAAPELNGNILNLDVPVLPAGLSVMATYLVFSEIETISAGKLSTERRTRLWELWSANWLDQIELPQIDFPRLPNRKYRWEVMFLAGPANFNGDLIAGEGVDLNTVTHVTRNATDL